MAPGARAGKTAFDPPPRPAAMSPHRAARTIRLLALVYIAVGVVWWTLAIAPIDAPGRLLFRLFDWPFGPGGIEPSRGVRWSAAVGGGLCAALGALFHAAVAPAVEAGDRRAARGAAGALLLWFALDSSGSIAAGAPSQALWNVPFLAAMLVPLLGMRPGKVGASSPDDVPVRTGP